MRGRASLWSDPELRKLTASFVPVTDEVWRLQQGADRDGQFFKRFADQGHYRGKGGTRQGVYVCTPSGKLLGSVNSLNAKNVKTMLGAALTAWQALPREERTPVDVTEATPEHRWEFSRPADGLLLRSTVRDLAVGDGEAWERTPRWNRDHAWFSHAEARAWFADEPTVGQRVDVPDVSRLRLIGLHLVDNVHGQTLPFAPQEIRESELYTVVTAKRGARVDLQIHGNSLAETDGTWRLGKIHWDPGRPYPRAIRTRLAGRATYDLEARRFVRFELIGLGQRRGRTNNNGRRQDPGPSPLGWFFTLAPAAPAGGVPPTFIDLYRVAWVRGPQDRPGS